MQKCATESHTLSDQTQPNRPIFYLVLFLIPILLLGAIEGGLRAFGYGKTIPLFVDAQVDNTTAKKTGFLVPNPRIIERYFHDPILAPKVAPDTFLFTQDKPQNTLRFVVMGGSSAAGFPYGRFGSPTGMLKQQLKYFYPNKNIELISVAMASINSYALRDFVEEVAKINPDAVIIYAGHNEYLGVMGVGSNFASYGGHWANLAFLALRDFRLFQLMQNLVSSSPEKQTKLDEKNIGRTVMATVAKEKNIPLDSPLYKEGLAQFESNMRVVLGRLNAKNIPVFIGDLVSNEQHQNPFESVAESQGVELSAFANFKLAQDFFKQSNYAKAREHFIRARDLDLLRFRAPSAFNQIIEKLAEESGAIKVNVDARLRADSEYGIIGQQHMLEHLHPTARGYFVIALAYLQAMQQSDLLESPDQQLSDTLIEELWQQIPLNDVDHSFAAFKVAQLTSDYPFKRSQVPYSLPEPTNQYELLALERMSGGEWIEQQQTLLNVYQRNERTLDAAIVAGVLFDALKTNHQVANIASLLFTRADHLRLAHYYARQAITLDEDNISYRLSYAEILFKRGLKEQSRAQLEYVLQLDPDNVNARRYLSLIG